MPIRPSSFVRPFAAVAMVAMSSLSAIAQPPPAPSRVRGTIESVNGDELLVKSHGGQDVKLHLAGDARVSGIVKIALNDIKLGSFIGTTTVPEADGTQKAIEVHVFPESMRGAGEGSRPWDLRPNSSMTNATVSDSVVGKDGRTLLVKYKGGEKKVVVPEEVPVVTYVPGDKSELKAGAKIVAFVTPIAEGSFEASRINVGRDGLAPPM